MDILGRTVIYFYKEEGKAMDRTLIPVSLEVRDYLRRLAIHFDNCSYDSLLRVLLVDHEIAATALLEDTKPGSEAYEDVSNSLLGIDEEIRIITPRIGGRPVGVKETKPRKRRAKAEIAKENRNPLNCDK